MKHRDYILAEIRDEDGNQDNLDKGDVCELAFTLAAERDEARKLAEDYRIFGIEKTMERDEARAKLGEARKLAEQWRNEATGSPSRGTRFPWEEK